MRTLRQGPRRDELSAMPGRLIVGEEGESVRRRRLEEREAGAGGDETTTGRRQ